MRLAQTATRGVVEKHVFHQQYYGADYRPLPM
jgi:hypothetical protein